MSQSHRQMLELRELREMRRLEAKEIADRAQAEKDEAERPLRQAEQDFQNTFKQYLKVKKDNVEAGLADGDFETDPNAPVWFATQEEAAAHNKKAGEEFVRLHPEYYSSKHNLDALGHYLKAQGIDRIISVAYLEQAFNRCSELGMLEEKPIEVPEPEPTPSHRTVSVQTTPEPAGEWGFNTDTGEREFKSAYLVSRMGAEEYKRFCRIPKNELDLARLVSR